MSGGQAWTGPGPGTAAAMTDAPRLPDYVDGLDFPLSREDLLRRAQELGADTALLQALRALPAERFVNAEQLLAELGRPG